MPAWETAARDVREALDAAILPKWKVPSGLTHDAAIASVLSEEQRTLTEMDASTLVGLLASGKVTAEKLTEAFCARAAVAHQQVNCLAVFFPDKGLERAKELDKHLAETGKPIGPLHGLPIALKDTFDVPGYATTWGYAANASHRATRESAVVKILREAGAVFYAKTTMPQAGMLLETISNLFGRTLNPRDPAFGCGGSSGGDGALVALYGSPVTPSTDIGGSIRAPAAFNGLYAIRPSADRVPKRGMKSVESGQLNIRVSCGPQAHSMADIRLLTEVLVSWPQARYDPTCIPVPWRKEAAAVASLPKKLAFGYWEFDGVVMPHPPILRGLRETAAKLKAAGHEVIPFKMPFDCWEACDVYMAIYYQCGNKGSKDVLAKAGEDFMPAYQKMLSLYKVGDTPIDANKLLGLIQQNNKYREILSDAWDATKEQTTTGRPIDGLLTPVAPLAGYPHDFLLWWGYTTLFNQVDYPSTVLPIKTLHINATDDPKDTAYKAQDNPFDQENQDIYDPVRWQKMPVTIQIVARPFDDEELVAVTDVVDKIVN